VAFASGMAATMAVFQTLAPGDHVVAPLDAYFGTSTLLREHLGPWGLQVSFADMTDLSAVQAALRPNTRLIWTETPSNPTIAVTDLKAVAAIAKSARALAACDNTWATPFLQRPSARDAPPPNIFRPLRRDGRRRRDPREAARRRAPSLKKPMVRSASRSIP
jgi:cystathionine gamma-synthase